MTTTPRRRATGTATLADVAAAAGVSAQTVSRAVRTPELVSTATLDRVREAIRSTGYVPNLAASNLASNRSMVVAVVLPSISASVFGDAVAALEEVLSVAGYQLLIGSTGYSAEREEEVVRALLGRRPDGFFVVGTTHTEATSRLLRSAGVPVVETWDLTDDPVDSLVGYSNADAVAELLEVLVRRGYRHPTFAGAMRPGDSRARERRRSFEATVPRLLGEEPVRMVDSGDSAISHEVGRQLLQTVLRRHPETDVLLFSSDVFATGALLDCHRRGIDVPGRLGITGFGDFEIGQHLVPRLTTVAVHPGELGRRAGEVLLESMAAPGWEPRRLDLGYSVIVRESA
ncbi:LacI family DNA-binding transcriptional regulator [Desertihabitans aurantiacus]|uniref:LacI family DNA-binding transcriptional regulator n=1 Tax=Desertihabitans aurantiacus TaxID=2282477 RepID=UPI000DF84389|nr:LacI family DNA-binding transcriptional regulator [Desertihabitans aurantiacus]